MAHSPLPIPAEISCFALSLDKRLVCYGTSEMEAKLMIWDLCGYVLLT